MPFLGLDIGGANLKVADGRGYAHSQPFPLWQRPEELARALSRLTEDAPRCDGLAVTMTGELADCFATKQDGVRRILDAVEQAAGSRRVLVYLTSGLFVNPAAARERWMEAAASNWHALASFAVRYFEHADGLLLDIGSTTTDIIPLRGGRVVAEGNTDPERLLSGELIYTGVERSPVCAVTSTLAWRGKECPVAAELFASTRDVYLLLGDLPEDATDMNTADGRPATIAAAHARLSRMICADTTMFTLDEARAAAAGVARGQLEMLAAAVRRIAGRCSSSQFTVVLSGSGEFLGQRLLEKLEINGKVISLSRELGPVVSRCAPAHAVAVLASRQ